jgi:hypothetical protein
MMMSMFKGHLLLSIDSAKLPLALPICGRVLPFWNPTGDFSCPTQAQLEVGTRSLRTRKKRTSLSFFLRRCFSFMLFPSPSLQRPSASEPGAGCEGAPGPTARSTARAALRGP